MTTVAGVNVVAALAYTGKHAGGRRLRNRLVRALRECTLIGPILNVLVDACMCALIDRFNALQIASRLIGHAYSVWTKALNTTGPKSTETA